MSSRSFSIQTKYRYGFNGKELDSDIGIDNYDFGARIYDARIGRWLAVDKLRYEKPEFSPYQMVNNSPLMFIDCDGNDEFYYFIINNKRTGTSEIRVVKKSNDFYPMKKWSSNLIDTHDESYEYEYYNKYIKVTN